MKKEIGLFIGGGSSGGIISNPSRLLLNGITTTETLGQIAFVKGKGLSIEGISTSSTLGNLGLHKNLAIEGITTSDTLGEIAFTYTSTYDLIRTDTFTIPASSDATWSISVPSWTETPVACLISWVRNSGAGTSNTAVFSYGYAAYDGASTYTQFSVRGITQHNVASVVARQGNITTRCLYAAGSDDPANFGTNETNYSSLEIVSFDVGGATFNYREGGTFDCGGEDIQITFFAASNARVGWFQDSAIWSTVENEITTPGFNPEVLLGCAVRSPIGNVANNITAVVGYAAGSGTSIEQASVGFGDDHNDGAGDPMSTTRNSVWLPGIDSGDGQVDSLLSITEFTTNGFSVQATVNDAAQTVGYLALDFGGLYSFEVGAGQFPASTSGTHAEPASSMGFTPDYVMMASGWNSTINAVTTSESGLGSFCLSFNDATTQVSQAISVEDLADPTNTQSEYAQQSFVMDSGDGTQTYVATLDSFSSGFWTLDWSVATPSTQRYFIYLAAGK